MTDERSASFRTHDAQWNRTGYAASPQYAGQAGLTEDYPAKCHCGATMRGCGDAEWLGMGKKHPAASIPKRDVPAWVEGRTGYVAWCDNQHEMVRDAV